MQLRSILKTGFESNNQTLPASAFNLRIFKYAFLFVLPLLILSLCLCSCQKEVLNSPNAGLNITGANSNSLSAQAIIIPAKSEALLAMDVFNNNFYQDNGTYGSSRQAYYWHDQLKTTREYFWVQCETIETLEDAYFISGNSDYKNKINYLFNGLVAQNGPLWSSNKYNDDIMWGSIMAVRAYQFTNDPTQLSVAKTNFDMVWNRSYDNVTGGGIWWTTDNTSKNTCVNGPAAVCAMKLFQVTGDTTYRYKAKLLMDWMINRVYIAGTGEVKGAVDPSGTVTEGVSSYNTGTFIGSANELRKSYPASNYLGIATLALDYARTNMCVSAGSYLKDESTLNTGDTQGFKSIFARYACIFVKETGTEANYGPWLDLNATQAWSIRNTSGLMWDNWSTRTLDILPALNDWQTNGGVSMLVNLYRFR